jgi:hypothetical protein
MHYTISGCSKWCLDRFNGHLLYDSSVGQAALPAGVSSHVIEGLPQSPAISKSLLGRGEVSGVPSWNRVSGGCQLDQRL